MRIGRLQGDRVRRGPSQLATLQQSRQRHGASGFAYVHKPRRFVPHTASADFVKPELPTPVRPGSLALGPAEGRSASRLQNEALKSKFLTARNNKRAPARFGSRRGQFGLEKARTGYGEPTPSAIRKVKFGFVAEGHRRNLGSWTPVSRIGGGRERIRNRFLTFERNFRRRTAGRGTQIAKPPNREGRRLCIEPLGRGAPTLSPSCVEKGQRPGPIKKAYARRSPPQAVFLWRRNRPVIATRINARGRMELGLPAGSRVRILSH